MDRGSLMLRSRYFWTEAPSGYGSDISGQRLPQVKEQIFLDRDSLMLRSRYFWTETLLV